MACIAADSIDKEEDAGHTLALLSSVQNDLLCAAASPITQTFAPSPIILGNSKQSIGIVYHPLLAACPQHPLASVPLAVIAQMLPHHPTGPLLLQSSEKPCLVLDLDETLVHAGFHHPSNEHPGLVPDFVLALDFGDAACPAEGAVIYVCKRPGMDAFLEVLSREFELVLFTASLAQYANPVIDALLDPQDRGIITHRLFRESCVYLHGLYVKDLGRLGRDLSRTLLVDNSPASFLLHPERAVACRSWYWGDGAGDAELDALLPLLLSLARDFGGRVDQFPGSNRKVI